MAGEFDITGGQQFGGARLVDENQPFVMPPPMTPEQQQQMMMGGAMLVPQPEIVDPEVARRLWQPVEEEPGYGG